MDGHRLVQRWNWYSLDDDSGKYENGQYYQFYNGNLLYSGLGANAAGLSPLGYYWQAYVRALPPASEPPYTLRTSRMSPQTSGSNTDVNSTEGHSCNGQWVRLVFTEPSSSGAFLGDHKEASRLIREELFCLSSQPSSQ